MREPIEAPARFVEAPDSLPAEPLPERWWESFADPQLETLMERALAGNLSLRSAWNRLTQAEAVARQAGVDLYPFLDADAGASKTYRRSDQRGKRDTRSTNEITLGVFAGYEVDLWGQVRSFQQAARMEVRASKEQLQSVAITLSGQLAETWYELVEQYGQVTLLEQQIHTNEQVLELITLRFRRGQAAAADVFQQRQLVESNHGERIQVQARVAVLRHALTVLLGISPESPLEKFLGSLPTELIQLPPLPEVGLPADLIRRRPDIRSAYYAVAAADQRIAVALADRYPRLSLSTRIATSGQNAGDLFRDWVATLGANLLAPLFDAGLRAAEVDRTRAVAEERLSLYGQTILEALAEVEDALSNEARQRELIASLDKQLQLSILVKERVRDRYLNGAEDYLRVLSALLSNQQLQRTRLTAERQLVGHRIALCRALAGGWELSPPEESVARTDP